MPDSKDAPSKVANQEFKVAPSEGNQLGATAAETVYVEYIEGDLSNTRITRKQPEKGYVLVQEGDVITQPMLDKLNEKNA